METFVIKRNDTRPSLEATLSDDNGPVDLTGASVKLAVKRVPSCRDDTAPNVAFKKEGVIVTPAAGVVRYDWAVGDTAVVGNYRAEFEVTFADGGVWSFPSSGFIPVTIVEDLG